MAFFCVISKFNNISFHGRYTIFKTAIHSKERYNGPFSIKEKSVVGTTVK